MLHDESIYANPFEFNPDRFINPKTGEIDYTRARDPGHACFGFGRRICPGRVMAFESLWLSIASLIATFEFEKAKEKVTLPSGEEVERTIELNHEYTSGLVTWVPSFPFPL
jgi:cytochrome P450